MVEIWYIVAPVRLTAIEAVAAHACGREPVILLAVIDFTTELNLNGYETVPDRPLPLYSFEISIHH